MNAYLPENYLRPFRVECYNNKLAFHSKEQCFKNGLKTKKSDLELNFFYALTIRGIRDVGHIPL